MASTHYILMDPGGNPLSFVSAAQLPFHLVTGKPLFVDKPTGRKSWYKGAILVAPPYDPDTQRLLGPIYEDIADPEATIRFILENKPPPRPIPDAEAPATDLASAILLVNNIRAVLIDISILKEKVE